MSTNIIYNDDCFNVFPKIEKDSIQLVLVDLPYGQIGCKWDTKINLEKMWCDIAPLCKINAIYAFFCSTKFGYELIKSKEKWFRYDIVMMKPNPVGFFNCNKQPLRQHEMVYIFSNPKGRGSIYNVQKTLGHAILKTRTREPKTCEMYGNRPRTNTVIKEGEGEQRFPRSVFKIKGSDRGYHPTQKSQDILEWLIRSYSNENDIVLDFTAGSGSTAVACITTRRNYICIEKDEKIFKVMEGRISSSSVQIV